MIFTAKLKPASAIRRRWIQSGRVGGVLGGVQFTKTANGDFVTGVLRAHEVGALQQAQVDVLVEARATSVHQVTQVAVDEPVEVSAPAAQPPLKDYLADDLIAQRAASAALAATAPPAKAKPIPPQQWKGKR